MMRVLALACWMAGTGCGAPAGGPALCITRCGVRFQGLYPTNTMPEGWTCEDIQHQEDVTLNYFQYVLDERFRPAAKACAAMSGFSVDVYAMGTSWVDQWGRNVQGLTFCEYGQIQISQPELNARIHKTAYSHEMAHAIQRCSSITPIDPGPRSDPAHADWERDNIYQMLDWIEVSP